MKLRSRSPIVLVTLVLLLAGCGDDESGGGDGAGGGSSEGTQTLAIPAQPPADERTVGEILAAADANRQAREQKVLDDARALGLLLNAFWARELQSRYQIAFDEPDRFEYYRGTQERWCGGPAQGLANNAYYCLVDADEHVAFDLAWLERFLVDHPGGATTFLILAHEWGHAVQDAWLESGGGDTWSPASRKELNADCLAGVFLAASIRDGSIVEEADDGNAIFGWLYEGGSSPWLAPGTHGTSTERQTAFVDGVQRGTAYCRTTY